MIPTDFQLLSNLGEVAVNINIFNEKNIRLNKMMYIKTKNKTNRKLWGFLYMKHVN